MENIMESMSIMTAANMTEEQKKFLAQAQSSQQKRSRGDKAIPEDEVKILKYRNYYDIANMITTAQATNPNDVDNANYNQEQVFVALERNAEVIYVRNDEPLGGATLYVIVSHSGGTEFSGEKPIYPKETKRYYNVFELRLRSSTEGHKYRVSEDSILT